MGASSSCADGKFVQIGEEYVGEEEKTFSTVDIYQIRFLQPKVIDRIIVQLRLEVKVGNLIWTILRSLQEFNLLKNSLTLSPEFSASFPDTDQRHFPDDAEIMKIQTEISRWLMAALATRCKLPVMLDFLGALDPEISETANTKIDLDTLIRTCETGDILLFKTHGFIPSSIRRLTNSNFDHVGVVVVRDCDDGGRYVCFLEASGDRHGVKIHSLRPRLLEWYLTDAQIYYRRLRCVRDTRFHIRTKSFVERVQGLKYGYSIMSVMLNKKDRWPGDKSKFFCSELVTAFYKHLGFIQSFARSHKYMPGDFAEKGAGARLNLVDAILEHEVKVTTWPRRTPAILEEISESPKSLRKRSSSLISCFRSPSNSKSSVELLRRRRSYSTGSIRIIRNNMDDEKRSNSFDTIDIEL